MLSPPPSNGSGAGSETELSAQEIDDILAEAMAVDELLQKKRPGPYDVVLALSAYVSAPLKRENETP